APARAASPPPARDSPAGPCRSRTVEGHALREPLRRHRAPRASLDEISCSHPSGLHLHEGAQPPVEGGSAPRHHARLENLEDLLTRGAEANGALHVRDETRPLRPPGGEERDGDELANLRGDVLAVAQPELVDVVVG